MEAKVYNPRKAPTAPTALEFKLEPCGGGVALMCKGDTDPDTPENWRKIAIVSKSMHNGRIAIHRSDLTDWKRLGIEIDDKPITGSFFDKVNTGCYVKVYPEIV